MFNYNSELQRNLNVVREVQQRDKQFKEDVLSVLISIDRKSEKILDGK
ncbi:hypothetical protein [Neobacillus drentensis]